MAACGPRLWGCQRPLLLLAAAGVAGLLILLAAPTAVAHPGNTDSSGGHTCRTNCPSWGYSYGEYHYHGRAVLPPLSTLPDLEPDTAPAPTPTLPRLEPFPAPTPTLPRTLFGPQEHQPERQVGQPATDQRSISGPEVLVVVGALGLLVGVLVAAIKQDATSTGAG